MGIYYQCGHYIVLGLDMDTCFNIYIYLVGYKGGKLRKFANHVPSDMTQDNFAEISCNFSNHNGAIQSINLIFFKTKEFRI